MTIEDKLQVGRVASTAALDRRRADAERLLVAASSKPSGLSNAAALNTGSARAGSRATGDDAAGFGDALRDAQRRQDRRDAQADAVLDQRAAQSAAQQADRARDARAEQNRQADDWHRQALALIDRAGQRAVQARDATSASADAGRIAGTTGGSEPGDQTEQPGDASAARKGRGLHADRQDDADTDSAPPACGALLAAPGTVPPIGTAGAAGQHAAGRGDAGGEQMARTRAGTDAAPRALDAARSPAGAQREASLATAQASGDAAECVPTGTRASGAIAPAQPTALDAAGAAAPAVRLATAANGLARNDAAPTTASPVAESFATFADLDDAAASIASPLGDPRWASDFSSRIAVHARGAATDVRLTLNPPELGPLKIVLQVVDRQITAQILSPHAAVREAAQAALPQLREHLQASGMTLVNAQVNDAPSTLLAADGGASGQALGQAAGQASSQASGGDGSRNGSNDAGAGQRSLAADASLRSLAGTPSPPIAADVRPSDTASAVDTFA